MILVGYGANEAFDGEAGLPRFQEGLDKLLDMLAPLTLPSPPGGEGRVRGKARIVLLSPLRQEDLGRPLPDPAAANKNLRLYRDALRKTSEKRGYPFVDLFELLGDEKAKPPGPLTDNGIHLTAFGYWWSAPVLERGLGLETPGWRIDLDVQKQTAEVRGATLTKDEKFPWRFQVKDALLPAPPAPADGPAAVALPGRQRVVRVRGLDPGTYELRIDGKAVTTAAAAKWDAGVTLTTGPDFAQAEKLRETIVAKNREYFHRWRPQNETYLFGFRKHEQGQNAREIPQFDPLVAKLEEEIAKLRVAVTRTYELVPKPEREK